VSLVGPEAEAMLDTLWFDQLFLGVSAIANDGALYSVDSAEASLNRCMLARSAASYLLADSSKFGATATYRVAPLPAAKVITDAHLASDWLARLADAGVETIVAEAGPARE
jgi:DeoR family fructose operon transcriptional repressor